MMSMMLLRYIKLLRPHQWIKNLLLLFPPFFAGKILDQSTAMTAIPSLLSFSLAASCSYIVNDIKDVQSDRAHREKKNRAIARGEISFLVASILAAALYVSAILISSAVSRQFELFLMAYLIVSLTYTFFFKQTIIVDVFFIACGFVIRVLAGGEAFRIPVSSWLFLTVFMVALFLSSGKRLGELVLLGEEAHNHRQILSLYSHSFLEGILWFSASSALVMYALYTLEHAAGLFYTVPLAAFGLLRYIFIAKQGKGDPTDVLFKDKPIMSVGLLWLFMIGIIIYR